MADPYAERERRGPGVEVPAIDSPLAEIVRERGGAAAAALAELEPAAAFGVVLIRDHGLVPPIARLGPEHAVILLTAADSDARAVGAALSAARAASGPLLLLKEGTVAGPDERPGAFAISPELSAVLLEASLAGEIQWEQDPDFDYEVAASAGGVRGTAARALAPRLLYADHDRVYEHADLVVEVKRSRYERLEAAGGTDPGLLAATGWPAEPTGEGWKR